MSTDMYEVVLLHVRRWQRQQRSPVGITAHDCITLLEQERLGSKLDHRCDLDWQYDAGAKSLQPCTKRRQHEAGDLLVIITRIDLE
eukprot:jgi/Chrpa1/8093/Chrysochromulina_OHIO_Genome00004180-RA